MNAQSPPRWQWIATAAAVAAAAAVIAGVAIAEQPATGKLGDAAMTATTITITNKECASGAANRPTGPAMFTAHNVSSWPVELYLVKLPERGTLTRSVTMGPGTSVAFDAILGPGDYAFQCLQSGQLKAASTTFTATGARPANATPAVRQATSGELQQANNLYLKHASQTLNTMGPQLRALTASLTAGDVGASRRGWLAARQTWAGLGAAYGSFGAAGDTIEGVQDPSLAPGKDPGFRGLGRIEYGLFHGERAAALAPVARQLEKDVAALAAQLHTLPLVPGALPLRAHEILEDTLRDTLSGQDNFGAGMAFAITSADVSATRATVADLATSLEARRPGFVDALNSKLQAVDASLAPLHHGDSWAALDAATSTQRQDVNAAVSGALESLADIPQLLVLPQGSE